MAKHHLLISLVAVAVLPAGATAQVTFLPPQGVALGTQPVSSALADLDSDGDLDIAVTGAQPPELRLLQNAGGASFTQLPPIALPAGSQPHGVAACDLDGDGDVDLAVALSGADAVLVLVRIGGAYVPGPTVAVGAGPRELACGDLDLDGDWDLVVGCATSGEAWVLRNQGALGFAATGYPAGSELRELAVAELTGDGLPDVALAAWGEPAVQILAGAGGATLVQGTTLVPGSLKPQGLAAGDLDGDGDVDLATCAGNGGTEFAAVWLNHGDGSFSGFKLYNLAAFGASSLALADFDLDGDLDLATANAASGTVATIDNDGTGVFNAFPSLWPAGLQPQQLVAGDSDGLGSPDLLVVDPAANALVLLRNIFAGPQAAATVYCSSKINSLGLQARISGAGFPAFGPQGFSVAVRDAVPGNVTIAFWGTSGPTAQPFLGGTLCVLPPTTRLPPRALGAGGRLSYAVPVDFAMAGTTRWYQFWYRDPLHPDGTGTALSDGLAVTFSN